jgi:hypothetical protein
MKQIIYYFYAYYSIFLTILLIFFNNITKIKAILFSLVFGICVSLVQALVIKKRAANPKIPI